MWKRIDELLSQSGKHATLSPNTFRVWLYTLIHSDISGVFPADARLIKSQCMPLLDVRLEQVEDALLALDVAKLIHLYDAGSKRYLVFHDHAQWNPPGNLRHQKGTYPSPPASLCPCIDVSNGDAPVPTAPVSSSSSSRPRRGGIQARNDEVIRQLFVLAKQQNILARDETLTAYLIGWERRLGGAGKLHEKLMDPSVVGKTVMEIQEWLFPRVAQKALSPAPKAFKCGTCNDTGKVVSSFQDRKPVMGECSCRRRVPNEA